MGWAMNMIKLSKISIEYSAVVLILACLSGCCLIGGQYLADEPIGKKRVEKISPGQTSIREVLTWLGPPSAIARSGKTVIFPPPSIGKSGSLEMNSDAFFELFSPGRALREEEVVYYYDASRKSSLGGLAIMILINFGGQTDRVKVERLWLLVDERTGTIEDYVYRPADRDVGRTGPSMAQEAGSR
jgi:hypothetical protein